MKKLMILGASYSLVPLIQAAKKLGFATVAVSIPGDYPGFSIADESCYADITKPREVLEAARRLQVSGIATCCMDVGLRSQGYAVTNLNLPGPSWETVCRCTNKLKMKQAFAQAGVHTAAFCQIKEPADLDKACDTLHFPLIIKAVDQMGSRGIFRCSTKEELYAYYPRTMAATKEDYCIVEEFLEGTMFGVEAMVQNGRLVYLLPVGNHLHQGNPPFPIGHYVPWTGAELYEDKIREQVTGAVCALQADNCPMDFDMMEKDGEIYVIEATARAGATGLAEQVGIHYGVDYYEAIVRLAMGEPVDGLFRKEKGSRVPNVVRLLEAREAGRVEEIRPGTCRGAELVEEILPGTCRGAQLVELSFNIKPGDRVRPMLNGRDRIGQVIIKGDSLASCMDGLEQVMSGIRVRVCHE